MNCDQCNGFCCRIMPIALLGSEYRYCLTELESRNIVNPKQYFSILLNHFAYLKAPCIFLQNNKCSIYNHRPMVCQQFPVNIRETMYVITGGCIKRESITQEEFAKLVLIANDLLIYRFHEYENLFNLPKEAVKQLENAIETFEQELTLDKRKCKDWIVEWTMINKIIQNPKIWSMYYQRWINNE